ncbi:family 20 glycosylhydrolase [Thalassotalea sp. PLHSN55]|uniref:family 20 glycosylhydrolase n=1 Tax=Thalassotalea sp. PLHSN55 TaxID=3435888 RepID=UPI003F850BD7
MNIKNTVFSFLIAIIGLSLFGCQQETKTEPKPLQQHENKSVSLSPANQSSVNAIAKQLDVNYRLVTNIPSEKCKKDIADGACFEVELTLTAEQAISANNWQIHFSQIAPIQSFESDEFIVEHLNGDLHKIALSENFKGFSAGESKRILFRAMFWSLSEYDALPNYIVSADNLQPQVIESTRAIIDPESGIEIQPFVQPYTDNDKHFKRTANDNTVWLTPELLYQRNTKRLASQANLSAAIIPTPQSVTYGEQQLDLSAGIQVNYNAVKPNLVNSALARLATLGIKEHENGVVVNLNLVKDSAKKIGGYHLEITPEHININGVDESGVFYALQSLASLVTVGESSIPTLTIDDQPHYEFRGMLVDVARNFHSKEFILTLLEQMGAYKLNKLHLHLGDDEGWRLEIPGLPELTDIGGQRCFDENEQNCLLPQLGAGLDTSAPVNGFYSVEDYTEILQAATARHIQVIPSLDMPGHARAAIKAMHARFEKYSQLEQPEKAAQFLLHDPEDTTKYSSVQFYNDNTINVCLESSYAFITEVMKQVKEIHAQAGQPLTRYHIGADETAGAWVESPACKEFLANNNYGVKTVAELAPYFVERVSNLLDELDIESAAWSDGLEHTKKENMPSVVQANAWGHLPWQSHKQTHELVNRNWQVVVSTPDVLYFDFPYEADPKEHGYYWASRQINTEKIFQFMPDNLPIHAEFWLDREHNPFEADDRKIVDDNGKLLSGPMEAGRKFLGIQGQLWSENTRNDNLAEHKVFPRLFALAERAWHLPKWAVPYNYQGAKYDQKSAVFSQDKQHMRDQQWANFAQIIGSKELVKLELANIDYRLPTVGAVIENGQLNANIAFDGVAIEYQEMGKSWQSYQQPVAVKSKVNIRSVSHDGARKSRSTEVSFN